MSGVAHAFAFTRGTLARLGGWIDRVAKTFPPPERSPLSDGDFTWRFPIEDAHVVQFCKAVRMTSGIRAAMHLADAGFVTESASLLRIVSEYASEILFLSESVAKGSLDATQEKFVQQFFAPAARTPRELAAREKVRYVHRDAVLKAHRRIIELFAGDPNTHETLSRFVIKGYDGYVHGYYSSAMELYHGDERRFLVDGIQSPEQIFFYRRAVAGKLHEVLIALMLLSAARGLEEEAHELQAARDALYESAEARDEYLGHP